MRRLAALLTCTLALLWAACGDSGTRGKISYLVTDSNNKTSLFTISSDGKTTTPVSINIPDTAYYVQPNRDATAVVYCRDEDSTGAAEIYLMGTDNQEKQLTHSDTDADNCWPSFSHDGKTIIFNSDRDDYIQIYTMKVDGSGQTHLITSVADDVFPKYSPDDMSFAFMRIDYSASPAVVTMKDLKAQALMSPKQRAASIRPHARLKSSATDTGSGIYTAKADGSNPTLVLSADINNLYFYSAPVFSADGKRLLFATGQFSDYAQIASVKLDGTDLKNLSNSEYDDFAPFAYGDQILFNRYIDGYVDIFTMNNDGSQQKNLTNTNDADEYLPDYQAYY